MGNERNDDIPPIAPLLNNNEWKEMTIIIVKTRKGGRVGGGGGGNEKGRGPISLRRFFFLFAVAADARAFYRPLWATTPGPCWVDCARFSLVVWHAGVAVLEGGGG